MGVTITPGWPVALACVLLVALAVATYAAGRLPGVGAPATAAVRAVVQLAVVAGVIAVVLPHLALSALLLLVMFAVAVVTTARRVDALGAWPWAAGAMLVGLVPVAAIILLSRAVPPVGVALVPVMGILIGNAMTAHTLLGRRAFAVLREERGQYEAGLSVGLRRDQAIQEIIHRRSIDALIPGVDATRTVGLVTLPGAFIGVLLGGGSPAEAAAAQLLVLLGIVAAQALTVVAAERLVMAARLLPRDLRASLRP